MNRPRHPKKFLVYTPFRCGSSFLVRLIKKNIGVQPIFLREVLKEIKQNNDLPLKDKYILKGHTGDLESLISQVEVNCVVTSIRLPTEIFASAFIKDIKQSGYPYFYEGEVSEEHLDQIVDFFVQFPWHEYKWLSYNHNFAEIQKITGVNIWEADFSKNQGIQFYESSSVSLVVATLPLISNDYNRVQDFFKDNFGFKRLDMSRFSFRNSDKHGDFYQKFIRKIPDSFYTKYAELDQKILEKFLV